MDNTTNREGKDNVFPPEYAHVGEMVREAQERIRLIDEQIKNVPKDQGPTLEYHPPGFLRSKQPGSHDQMVSQLEKQKDQIKVDIMGKVGKETGHADPTTARKVRDVARERFYPNPYKGMDAVKMTEIPNQPKDLDASQDFVDAQRNRNPALSRTENEKDASDQPNVQPVREGQKSFSMSSRFLQSLNYPMETEKAEKALDKSPERQKGKEDMDKG